MNNATRNRISPTHEVINQPDPLSDYNPFDQHPALRETLQREGGGRYAEQVRDYGALAADEVARLGFEANRHAPELDTHDRFGHRIDQVNYHPAYHQLMALGIGHGLSALTWSGEPGARVARSAMIYLHNRFEAGTMCPMTMTHAVLASLRLQPDVAEQWQPRVLAATYDQRFLPAEQKQGATLGMAMTEKQGGSDVRANTTRAAPLATRGPGQEYLLVGHKWFCSAPMSDAFLTLAQTEEGLSCFLVPRFCPDGSVNPFHLIRLKDKLGNRSNASAEVEFPGTWGVMVGEPGRGVATIIRMVAETRLDCAIGSASLMHQALSEAIHHCDGRQAFGRCLSAQPLMQNVLADMALESEAALVLALHLAGRFERAGTDAASERIARLATPVAKYWLCKRAVGLCYEAMECLGGNGYVEESMLPRLFREAPVNAIWEGSGNIQCLDVLRAIDREPETIDAFRDFVEPHAGDHPALAAALKEIGQMLGNSERAEFEARRMVEAIAVTLQAAVLLEAGNDTVAETFIVARLVHGNRGGLFGNLGPDAPLEALVARSRPGGH
ncbi:MAG: DNA alkylation response protein [Pseudomonadota bacterium]|nr:MAG: DNA alkylation response protein [Pseudomonadota bacterium]